MADFCVYVLHSLKLGRYYVGTTDDFERRFLEHNNGSYNDSFTKKGIPWTVYLIINNLCSEQAYKIEKKIKSQKSVTYILNLKKYPEMLEKLKNI
jgi:putative endonuclease